MPIIHLEGYDTLKISDERITIPPIAQLLREPNIMMADPEDVYKNCGEFYRYMLSKIPITNTKRHITVYSNLQYVRPPAITVPTIDWHCDGFGHPTTSGDLFHVCMNDSSDLCTEFLESPIDMEVSSLVFDTNHKTFRDYLQSRSQELNFKGKPIPTNRFVTFTCRHAHKAPAPQKPLFRFFWKVCESDSHFPLRYEDALKPYSKIFMGNNQGSMLNIEQGPRGIIIRDRAF